MTQESFETRTFALTVRDYAAYAFFGYYRALVDGKVALLQVAATASTAFWLKTIFFPRDDFAAMWPTIVAYPALMLTVMPLISVALAVRAAKRTPNLTEAGTIAFTPDGFVIKRGQLNASLDWGAFKKIIETRKAIYLTRTSEAHIVPKSAFASMEVARAAAAFARRSIRQAGGKTRGVISGAEAPQGPDERVSPPFEMTFRIYAQLVIRNALSGGPGIVLLFMPCAIIALVAWTYRADILAGFFDVFLLPLSIAVGVALFILLLVLALGWMVARKVPTTMGQRRVAIAPGYVRASGDGYAAQFAWRDLQRVVRTRKYLICYTRPRGYIVLPASAFATRAEADAFFDQAKAWADAARTV